MHVVAALPSDIAHAVEDFLTSMPLDTAPEELERTVLQHLEPLQQSRLQKLISDELGYQRLSQLLHPLRRLFGEHS